MNSRKILTSADLHPITSLANREQLTKSKSENCTIRQFMTITTMAVQQIDCLSPSFLPCMSIEIDPKTGRHDCYKKGHVLYTNHQVPGTKLRTIIYHQKGGTRHTVVKLPMGSSSPEFCRRHRKGCSKQQTNNRQGEKHHHP